MDYSIRVIPHGIGLINSEENALILEWGNEAWGGLEVCRAFRFKTGADYCVLVYSQSALVGFATVFRREVQIEKCGVSMGCVGNVITHPDFRGMGCGTLMMREMNRLIHDVLECQIGGLLCQRKTVPFFGRLGWKCSKEPVLVERGGEKVEWPEAFMYHAKSEDAVCGSGVDLCGLPW